MSPERFQQLLEHVGPHISKQDTNFRKSIPVAKRLVITLRYLSRGIPQETLAYNFRVGCSTVAGILIETCDVIYKVLSPIYLRPPSSEEERKLISSEFNKLWNTPHVLGAIDGKHINIECPKNTGSQLQSFLLANIAGSMRCKI